MNTSKLVGRLSGRSRSEHPPLRGPVLDTSRPDSAPDESHGITLYLEGITVSFDGFKALNDLTLYIRPGELRCIIGPNGAGKTTMMDVITGKTRPDQGSAWFGQSMDLLSLTEPEIASAGIGRKFQKPTVFEHHSVFENLELAIAGDRSVWRLLVARLTPGQRQRIDEVLEIIQLAERRHERAGSLSHGQKQWLEVAMVLVQKPRLLLLDEPLAGLSREERGGVKQLIAGIPRETTVVMIEHDMDTALDMAERITVLHYGRVIVEGTRAEVVADPKTREVYLGD